MSELNPSGLKRIFEGAIFAANHPLNIEQLRSLVLCDLSNQEIRAILDEIANEYAGRGVELKEVATGFRFQVCSDLAPYIQQLWEEKPVKYSRALLETLALIVYRQPITRSEIEEIRGVAVSTNIIKTLMEREWVKIIGHKELPGKPALYATTKKFLEDFNLKSLSELPALSEIILIEQIAERAEQQLQMPQGNQSESNSTATFGEEDLQDEVNVDSEVSEAL